MVKSQNEVSDLLEDERFKNSLTETKARYSASFENAANGLLMFMTDPYITSRSPGQPYTSFLMRYFMQRAMLTAAGEKRQSKKQFKKLMRVFEEMTTLGEKETGSDIINIPARTITTETGKTISLSASIIRIPDRKKIEEIADEIITNMLPEAQIAAEPKKLELCSAA